MTLGKTKGGAFLIEERAPEEIFTPEDFSEEHLAIARAAAEFREREIAPQAEAIERQDPGVAVGILRKAAEIGLTAVTAPERYGGMEMDLVSALIVAEQLAGNASMAAWFGAHAGIGTMPLLLFGTEEQKQRYLPRLARAGMVAAYALTEPHAGSDALAARTRADLSADGRHYVLNGQKMWITNGGAADLFVVFAKVGGERFTAFLVERGFGVKSGAEEKKMGIKGSSTTALYFDNVPVPVENVLGEIGRGHAIAFNILNLGRLKLGPFAVGAAKEVLGHAIRYAKERRAFGHAIADFGLIRHKLAEMAARIYAAECMVWRTAGLIEGFGPEGGAATLEALEEFAPECSMVKVWASEALDYVADEGVQIFGGYGYHQDYAVERAYRDARINRIFEGTNEINRLLTAGMLLKRAARGHLPLVEAAGRVMRDAAADPPRDAAAAAKSIALLLMGAAYQRYGMELEKEQEVLAGITDVAMDAYAVESALLRSRRLAAAARGEQAADLAAVLGADAMSRVETTARTVLAACAEGDTLKLYLTMLRRFAKQPPVDTIALRRRIAGRLLEAGRY